MKFNKWVNEQINRKTELISGKKSALKSAKKELKQVDQNDYTSISTIENYISKLENEIFILNSEIDKLIIWNKYKPVRTKTGVAVLSKQFNDMVKNLEARRIPYTVTHTDSGLIVEYGKEKVKGSLELYAIPIPADVELPPLEIGEVVQSA